MAGTAAGVNTVWFRLLPMPASWRSSAGEGAFRNVPAFRPGRSAASTLPAVTALKQPPVLVLRHLSILFRFSDKPVS